MRPAAAPAQTRALAVALLLAVAGAGCLPRTPPPDLSLEPAALLAQVGARQARVTSVSGEARVSVEAPGGGGTVGQFLAARRPDALHVEALDFFGNPVAVLVAEGGRFALWDARQKVFYRGRATPENLGRLLPLPLEAAEAVEILCGGAPLRGDPVRVEPGRGFATLVLAEGSLEQALRVGPGATVERSEVRARGEQPVGAYDLAFDDRDAEGARFPRALKLRASSPKVKLDVRWKDATVNGPLDDALFRLSPPRGARVVDLDAPAEPPPPARE